nr:unnamed protein product [Callosobruchus chinensis]
MKNKFTLGPGGIPLFIVRQCALVLVGPSTKTYNLRLKTNTFPHIWRVSKVTKEKQSSKYRKLHICCNCLELLKILRSIGARFNTV